MRDQGIKDISLLSNLPETESRNQKLLKTMSCWVFNMIICHISTEFLWIDVIKLLTFTYPPSGTKQNVKKTQSKSMNKYQFLIHIARFVDILNTKEVGQVSNEGEIIICSM